MRRGKFGCGMCGEMLGEEAAKGCYFRCVDGEMDWWDFGECLREGVEIVGTHCTLKKPVDVLQSVENYIETGQGF
jgi:hypothetical protein